MKNGDCKMQNWGKDGIEPLRLNVVLWMPRMCDLRPRWTFGLAAACFCGLYAAMLPAQEQQTETVSAKRPIPDSATLENYSSRCGGCLRKSTRRRRSPRRKQFWERLC